MTRLIDTIVLHHSANPNDRPQAEEIKREHLKNPNIKQAGAYHFVLERNPDGALVVLHDENFVGNHAGNYKINARSLGICLAGDFSQQEPTAAQTEILFHLLLDLQQRYGIPDENIKLHREVRIAPTACPCKDLRVVYFARREKDRERRKEILEHARLHAKGQRLQKIIRILDRLMKVP
jgi:N-acetyl-anhydromuramyl-L-alanine amidase AmpD